MTQIQSDPRTYQAKLSREGKPGHPGFSRDEEFLLRWPPHMRESIEQRAYDQKRSMTDVVLDFCAVGLWGPLPSQVPIQEPLPPELTPEVAYENLDVPLKKADPEPERKPTEGENKTMSVPPPRIEPPPQGPNIWTPLSAALKERVSEENFEIWLSSIRFVGTDKIDEDKSILRLQVPNTHFQEYLAEHYTEVIQEELLRKYNDFFEIDFVVIAKEEEPATPSQPPTPKTPALLALLREEKVSTLDQLEAVEDRLLPIMYQQRLDDAQFRATPKKQSGGDALGPRAGRYELGQVNQARLAEEVAILKDQRLKEEAARVKFRKERRALFAICRTVEQMRQPGNPQSHRQYSRPSHFDTDGPLTRGDLPKKKDLS